MRKDEEREGRRRRVAGLFDTRAGSVALLIAVVLVAQAGLVYVAVDQIGADEPTFVQPARTSRSPDGPISVEADPKRRVPAPAATRNPRVVETESEETPVETGLDRASEQADPRGVAPPPTGNAPAGGDAGQDPPASERPPPSEQPQGDPGSELAANDAPSDSSDPHEHQEKASEPPAEDHETQHGRHGHGAEDHEPPGQGGDNPGNDSDDDGEEEREEERENEKEEEGDG